APQSKNILKPVLVLTGEILLRVLPPLTHLVLVLFGIRDSRFCPIGAKFLLLASFPPGRRSIRQHVSRFQAWAIYTQPTSLSLDRIFQSCLSSGNRPKPRGSYPP